MDENTKDGSYTRYKMPTEKDIANANIQKEVAREDTPNSSITESYVIKNNTVK